MDGDLASVGLSGRNDAYGAGTWRVGHHVQAPLDAACQLETIFSVNASSVFSDDAVGIGKHVCSVGKVEAALKEARFALVRIPLESHRVSVVQ